MKTCQAPDCGNPIDQDRRSDSIYCSNACKRRAMRARKRERKSSNFLGSFGTDSVSRESDGGYLGDSHAADARFRSMLAADEARRVPQKQAAQYAEFERRNPGVAHPGRIQERTRRGLQARASDWEQGTARFQRPTSTLADQARASRARQRRPVMEPVGESYGHDELEAAQMIDGNVFRSGYRHASAYR